MNRFVAHHGCSSGSPPLRRLAPRRLGVPACFVLTAGAAFAQPEFATTGVAGLCSQGSVPLDADGDGRIDLLTFLSPESSMQFAVYRGEGFGISAGPPLVSPVFGFNPFALAVGDIDGDAIPDALAYVQDTVSTHMRLFRAIGDGTGHFASSVTSIDTPWNAGKLADVDLDGDLDLVGVGTGALIQLRNDGTGTFSLAHIEFDTGLTGDPSPYLIVDDLDGDGDPDAVAMATYGTVRLFTTTGSGINAKLTFAGSIAVGSPESLTATDLHGDGDVDLAVIGSVDGQNLRVIESAGDGTFAAPVLLSGSATSTFAAGADVDLDGFGDLVTETEVFRSAASGMPALSSVHSLPRANRVEIADFDADSRPDLLLITDTSLTDPANVGVIAWNDGAGRFPGRAATEHPNSNGAFALGHYDGDTVLDVLAVEALPPAGLRVARIERGIGDGTFVPAPTAATIDVVGQIYVQFPPVISADVNHDGRADLLACDSNATVTSPRVQAFLADGALGFLPTKTSSMNAVAHQLHVGFVDADPHPDLITQRFAGTICELRVLFGNGLGDFAAAPFATPVTIAVFTGYPEPMGVADVTGDGLADVIVRVGTSTAMEIHRGLGDGSFQLHSTFVAPQGLFVVAPLDGDAQPDFAVLSDLGSTMRLEVRPGLSGGGFGAGLVADYAGISKLVGCVARDIDADGFLDLVAWTLAEGSFAVFPNVAGAFGSPIHQRAGIPLPGYPTRQPPHFGDVTGDGRLDAVVASSGLLSKAELLTILGVCGGRTVGYGHGCPGASDFVPKIAIVGAPCPGDYVTFEIRDGLGGSFAVVFLGAGETIMPITGGCDLLIAPLLPFSFSVPLSGVGAGSGAIAIPALLPPTIADVTLTMQAFVADSANPGGISATAGLAVRFGD